LARLRGGISEMLRSYALGAAVVRLRRSETGPWTREACVRGRTWDDVSTSDHRIRRCSAYGNRVLAESERRRGATLRGLTLDVVQPPAKLAQLRPLRRDHLSHEPADK
jgi:hypothetical protein